jgi:hypothetical protein
MDYELVFCLLTRRTEGRMLLGTLDTQVLVLTLAAVVRSVFVRSTY